MNPVRIVVVRPDRVGDLDPVVRAASAVVDDLRVGEPTERDGLVSVPLDGRLRSDVATVRQAVTRPAQSAGWDVAVVSGAPLESVGLLVLDVDSTLITAEVIELLAEHAGSRTEVAAVTDRAMRGEIDFVESLRDRVATLAGVPVGALEDVMHQVHLAPGATALIARAREHGATIGLVSGGFTEVVTPVASLLGITHVRANSLEVADGRLTGRVSGPVVDRAGKATAMLAWADQLGVPAGRTVAIGDGANDLDMLAAAGLGIAYRAKPVVAAGADAAIEIPRLDVAAEFLRW
ncbi:phosphoserine phosphatase SerB [Auraticoccus monumenti]|uniref:phosphoserine phosphatase n=1 Tax=Auraticoccus monumenti TaxID=675864 RepID=A0A1G6X492_9ACTN|nr:phosphoserine phosphatase SerB [Auraticoccus monumenti]SDD72928.1 phosphoserine phosphatase [Auraticoccus monumenti]